MNDLRFAGKKLLLGVLVTAVALGAGCTVSPTHSTTPSSSPEWDDGEDEASFGDAVRYTTAHSEIPLEVTVQAPVPFKPGKGATVWDGGYEREGLKAVTVYFTVTIANASRTKSYKYPSETLFSNVAIATFEPFEEVWRVSDKGIEGLEAIGTLKPGESVTFKDGFTVPGSETIIYELAFEGQAGRTIAWSEKS